MFAIGLSLIAILIGTFIMNQNWAILMMIGLFPYLLYIIILRKIEFFRQKKIMELFFFPCIVCSIIMTYYTERLDGYDVEMIFMIVYYNLFFIMGFCDEEIYDEY